MGSSVEVFVSELIEDYSQWAKLFMIRDKDNNLVPLELNEVQEEIGRVEKEELALHGQARIYVLKARQGGVTTDQQARNLHCIWSTPGANTLTIAHAREDTDKIFQITRRAIQNFEKTLLPALGRGEAKEITFVDLDSRFWTGTAGAKRVGKGITLTRFHGSEFAFWENPEESLGNITPALIPRGSVVVLETTPDQYGSEAHKFWQRSKEGETGYRCLFFPWWRCDRKNYRKELSSPDELGALTDEEKSLVEAHSLELDQIKWRRLKIKEIGRSRFIREYPEDDETCWITAGDKFYDSDTIEILLRKTPTVIDTAYGGKIKIYGSRAMRVGGGIVYEDVIIGADVAEGSTSGVTDRTTWTARSFPSWRLLSQFSSNRIEPTEFASLLYTWAMDKYGEALLVVEKNFHGITVLRALRDTLKYPKKSLYHRTPLSKVIDQYTDYLGWTTTAESKPLMLDYGSQILNAARDGYIEVPTRDTLIDALAVTEGVLTGRDLLVSEILSWIGREYRVRTRVQIAKPIHW